MTSSALLSRKKAIGYASWAVVFVALSFMTLYFVFHTFADGSLHIPVAIFTPRVVVGLIAAVALTYLLASWCSIEPIFSAQGV